MGLCSEDSPNSDRNWCDDKRCDCKSVADGGSAAEGDFLASADILANSGVPPLSGSIVPTTEETGAEPQGWGEETIVGALGPQSGEDSLPVDNSEWGFSNGRRLKRRTPLKR